MKLLNQPIEMISWTSQEGKVTPIRFRMEENGEMLVVSVDTVLQTEEKYFGGAPTLCFRCSSILCDRERIYELTCDCHRQKWLLKKM